MDIGKLFVRHYTSKDDSRLTEFRIDQYKSAREFELVDSSKLSQKRGCVYVVEESDKIISSMQVERSGSLHSLKLICNVNVPADFSSFDTLYLSKAATAKECRNIGLNSLLRNLVLETALTDASVSSLTGVGYEFAPRLKLLAELGYKFFETRHLYPGGTVTKGRLFFMVLERRDFGRARDIISKKIKSLLRNVALANPRELIG